MPQVSESPWDKLSAELEETQRVADILANKVHGRVSFLLGDAPPSLEATKASVRPPAQGALDDLHIRLQGMRNALHMAIEDIERLS